MEGETVSVAISMSIIQLKQQNSAGVPLNKAAQHKKLIITIPI